MNQEYKKSRRSQKLYKLAKKFQKQSHSPYSKCALGASVYMSDGKYFGGCNIENASYGGTVCAERVAIWKAISENRKAKVKEIMVFSPGDLAWPPCGMCRQVLVEFSLENTTVYSANKNGIQKKWILSELIPEAFESSFLKKP